MTREPVSLRARVEALASRAAPAHPTAPGWEQELLAWLETASRIDGGTAASWNSSPEEASLSLLLAAADASLGELLSRGELTVLPSARRALVGILSRRLVAACVQVLVHERQALDATASMLGESSPVLDPSVPEWLERFETYPVLAWLLTRVLSHWRAYLGELLARLAADTALLGDTFFQGHRPRALADVRGELGDPHGGGRSVAVLQFEEERHVVYKPKDLRITRRVQELCAFLNARGLPVSLHVREVLCREGYAWEEFVPPRPCRTAEEVERFYFRVGMLLRLFQVLEGRDLWLDNLVAAGEHPVFVDLEMMLQPRRRAPTKPPVLQLAEEQLREAVALLGILASPLAIAAGEPAEDVGALTPPRAFASPLRVHWTRTAHVPALEGQPASAVEHLDAILEGYRAMHAGLRASSSELLGPEGPLARMAGLPVRYIHRDTWTCFRLTQAGLAPSLLMEPRRREAAFAHLLRAASAHPEREAEHAAVQVEVEALRQLDIPYFLCTTDGSALLGPHAELVREGFFEGDALSRARQRIQELDSFPLARHEALLRSTFATGRHVPRPPAPLQIEPEPSPDWLTEAVAVGDAILGEAIAAGGALAWLGVTYQPLHDLRRVDVLSPDILTGSAGIALVLADLYRASGHERFRTAALGALEATRWAVLETPLGVSAASRAPLEVGAFRGLGAQLYALHRCALALDRPELDTLAKDRLGSLSLEALRAQAPLDVVSGLTGLLLVLLAVDAPSAARSVVEVLEQRLAQASALLTWPGFRLLDGLPPPAEGLRLCTARLERLLGMEARWRTPEREAAVSVGAMLTRLAMAQETGNAPDALRPEVLRMLESAPSHSVSGRLDAIELALAASEAWGAQPFLAQARRLGGTLLAERRLRGRWFFDLLEADVQNLSAIWGLPAVAHTLLRLHDPRRVPSLRLIVPGARLSP